MARIQLLLLGMGLVACADANGLQDGRKIKTQGTTKTDVPQQQQDATPPSAAESEKTPPADDAKDSEQAPPAEKFEPVMGAALTCAVDYAGLPATETMPRYGCRVALVSNQRVDVPTGVNVELSLFSGTTPVTATVTPAPATSLWNWYIRTDAKGPLTAQMFLRNAEIAAGATPSVKVGTQKYASEKVSVEGSALQWVVNGGVASVVGDGNIYRTTLRQLTFTGTFPKFLTVNRATGRPTQMYAGFLVGTNRLTCRYNLVTGLTTFYMIDTKTCRRGPVDFEPAAVNNPGPPPYDTDLSNPAVAWSLDTLVVGATQWYTDWVITPGDRAQLEPPVGVVTTGSIREFKMP